MQTNPARKIKLAARRRREPPFLTPAEFDLLVRELSEPTSTMVLLSMLTSMRIGEILALRWRRVDLVKGVVKVAETFYRGQFATTKTKCSERQIPLADVVLWRLQARYAALQPDPDDLVFATSKGTPFSDGNLRKRVIYAACERLRIPHLTWHALRHLHGSLLSQLGVPVAVTQAQLGHADPRITLQIYTHVMPGAQRDAVERLERYLFPNVPKLHLLEGNTEYEGAGIS